jgi:nucleotide-binding universal stress UspA family protein
MTIERILLAVAGLGKCEEMYKALAEVPGIQRATVTVLHVVPPQISADDMVEKLALGGQILAKAVEVLQLPPDKINARLKQGDPKDVVCQVADEENADLIIIGSRGLSRLESILSNSVSQYVFQLTSRPMLLVKDDISIKKMRRVMVAYDDSAPAKAALKLALFLLRDNANSQLLLTSVKKDSKVAEAVVSADRDPILASAISEAKKMGVAYKCIITSGNPGAAICEAASEYGANLLILGSPDRRPSVAKTLPDLDRLLGNSISDYVRVKADCPVLLTRTST